MINNAAEQNNEGTQPTADNPQAANIDAGIDLLLAKLEQLWGEDLDKNLLLSKRGLAWLGFDEETIKEDFSEIVFLNKMVDLGKLLSEDAVAASGENNSFNMTPAEAKKIRSQIISQKDILEALNNKGNMRHNEVLSYVNRLNEIIAKEF
ncbi:MAG: hypothetical protein FWE18_05765 [Alphaproteobacteria bacterium]|nr:hypothetical protein [Alphaproteobacteria bacterium]